MQISLQTKELFAMTAMTRRRKMTGASGAVGRCASVWRRKAGERRQGLFYRSSPILAYGLYLASDPPKPKPGREGDGNVHHGLSGHTRFFIRARRCDDKPVNGGSNLI